MHIFMLRQNPKGGRPMTHIGTIDWDETYSSFQYKLGYCVCGKKILATPGEIQSIMDEFKGLQRRPRLRKRIGLAIARMVSGEHIVHSD